MSGVMRNRFGFRELARRCVMMTALIAATLCSVILMSAPAAARSYVYARKKDPRKRYPR